MALVLWTLVCCSFIVFALQSRANAAAVAAHARYRTLCARWTARGGVHYTIGQMNARFGDEPWKILQQKQSPDFYNEFRQDELGWFVGEYPFAGPGAHNAVTAEQGRMPLGNLTTAAMQILFADSTVRLAVAARLASPTPPPSAAASLRRGVEPARSREAARPAIAHPLELLSIDGVTLDLLFGQDWNENGVLDPHERGPSRRPACPAAVTRELGLSVDRGLMEVVTTFTDGKFIPGFALRSIRDIYLGDWPGASALYEKSDPLQPTPGPSGAGPAWLAFASSHLAATPRYFRVPVFGTCKGTPAAYVRCIAEFVPGADSVGSWYRVVDWRQDD